MSHRNAPLTPTGRLRLARCVVEGIRQSKLDLARSLADDVPPFDPARPDPPETFALPASPHQATDKPDGN